MITSVGKAVQEVQATSVRFEGNRLYVSLSDEREISVPMDKVEWLGWLAHAMAEERERWSIEPGGFAIYWEDLENGIELSHLMTMQPLV